MTTGIPKTQVDTSKPHPARVYDCLLGGKDNYPVDRQVARQLPENSPRDARLNRAFMHRAVAWLAESGIDQFLDIGTGIPTEPNLHQVAQRANPACRVVYSDNDPIVLRHAEALLISTPEGATDYIQADVREPEVILQHARSFLDFSRPVALSLIALMHFIPDGDDPYAIARALTDALAPGSFFVLTQGTADFHPDLAATVSGTYKSGGISLALRSREQVARFFDGLDLEEPGLVRATEWYRTGPAPELEDCSFYVGVARVPER
ncbi:SAM-dependent methyltransferase [Streptomyces montanisoli]|uniref:SAM-dependent methyltransferase n=1 Tax=Streptomyces montanisoli TaxID=2798581 RepID=A0A940MK11_9ACTN|nr:SAM-dependent methyltransferase [Streptomyces montanisoli]MBP0461606.1 SAM-dependent methyltransferase [Streptomyces montanisoli]